MLSNFPMWWAEKKPSKSQQTLLEAIGEQDLLVPVVGGFSAGKSTALNAFLGESVLSVAITPETALATELRYIQGESYAEGVRENGEAQRLNLAEFGKLKERASEFSFARLYLNNAKLREIAPLVLVDMPGFDSSRDTHDKAIKRYIDNGSHFIVLESVERGAVEASVKGRIREFNGKFTFCLSKTDGESPTKIAEVKESIASDLKASFGYEKPIFLLDDRDKTLDEVIASIDKNVAKEEFIRDFFHNAPHFMSEVVELNEQWHELQARYDEVLDKAIKKSKAFRHDFKRKSDDEIEEFGRWCEDMDEKIEKINDEQSKIIDEIGKFGDECEESVYLFFLTRLTFRLSCAKLNFDKFFEFSKIRRDVAVKKLENLDFDFE